MTSTRLTCIGSLEAEAELLVLLQQSQQLNSDFKTLVVAGKKAAAGGSDLFLLTSATGRLQLVQSKFPTYLHHHKELFQRPFYIQFYLYLHKITQSFAPCSPQLLTGGSGRSSGKASGGTQVGTNTEKTLLESCFAVQRSRIVRPLELGRCRDCHRRRRWSSQDLEQVLFLFPCSTNSTDNLMLRLILQSTFEEMILSRSRMLWSNWFQLKFVIKIQILKIKIVKIKILKKERNASVHACNQLQPCLCTCLGA